MGIFPPYHQNHVFCVDRPARVARNPGGGRGHQLLRGPVVGAPREGRGLQGGEVRGGETQEAQGGRRGGGVGRGHGDTR